MKTFFVGGPWHGEIHEIPDDTNNYIVAESPDIGYVISDFDDPISTVKSHMYSTNRLLVFDRYVEYMAINGSKSLDIFFDAIVRPELKEFFLEAPEPFKLNTKQRNSESGKFELD